MYGGEVVHELSPAPSARYRPTPYAIHQKNNLPAAGYLGLPHSDGLAMLARLQSSPAAERCRVVAVRGTAVQQEVQALYEAGCVAYLCKPYAHRRLLQLVDQLAVRRLNVPAGSSYRLIRQSTEPQKPLSIA